jgi:hypothetical protein
MTHSEFAKKTSLFIVFWGSLLLAWSSPAPAADPPPPVHFYVSTNGNDNYSGMINVVNADKTDGPFATLERARKAIRQHKKTSAAPCSYAVMVLEGVYYLPAPLTLEPEDSGDEQHPISYTAYPGARPTLSGGRPVTGWKPWKNRIWQCDLKPLGLNSLTETNLYYNDQIQPLARVPNLDPTQPRTSGFLYLPMSLITKGVERVKENSTEGTIEYDPADWRTWQQAPTADDDEGTKQVLQYDPATLDPSGWRDIDRIGVHLAPFHNWINEFITVKEIDRNSHQILLSKESRYPLIRDTRFYFTNIFSELDAPGEWFLDAKDSILYFWPPEDGSPEGRVVITALDGLVKITGKPDNNEFVRHIQFGGFRLQHTRGGYIVHLIAAEHCRIFNNIMTNMTSGICLDAQCRQNRIVGNDIADLSAKAMAIGGENNLADNNTMHDIIAYDAYQSSAVSVGGRGNTFSHNLIHDVPAIGLGFGGRENIIEFNEIHHVGLASTLSGGIYAYAGNDADVIKTRGNIIRYNKITDVVGYGMAAPGEWGSNPGWGIWLDDFISDTALYGNILVRCPRGGVQVHGGKRNVFENNILAAGLPSTINHIRKGAEPCNNVVRRNIICYSNPDPVLIRRYGRVVKGITGTTNSAATPLFLCGWHIVKDAIEFSDYNLLYPIRGLAADRLHYFEGAGDDATGPWADEPVPDRFAWWRSLGYEAHSIIADPGFVDLRTDNFNLPPDSPGQQIEFKPIPIEQIGPYAGPDRATWPLPDHHKKWRDNTVQPYASFIH